ncbi:TonB-dependent receptor [Chlorogloeopsis sp. ULAP01]|uniref:TonB-dependent receptor n=1 Tax=Chlorogloeopsis sp. ULAP01 TaxID=3056483 RepID=UPI0025AA5BDB|nr:TonB-dependent receptor [Chlorogloeopsis sp. ULAP01]MDM9383745.1 TonB-dependent receptor [Chlorogloeopsis sp. ULAP01]
MQAKPTDKGVEVILQTTQGEQLQITNRSEGSNFIADIPNAQLRLPSGDAFTFRSKKPIVGITEITVTNLDTNTIRVTVIGEAGLPTVELFDSDEGLIFGLAPVATATQPPQPEQPTGETPQEEPSAQQDEPIELVVTGQQDGYRAPNASTATRTDTPLRDIPASIQVVPRQVLEDQKAFQLDEALRNVSGVQPTNSFGGNQNAFRIRGFDTDFSNAIIRDGVRDNATVGGLIQETVNLQQIEVLKGPASVLYGQLQPGGVINLVTKQPLAEPYYSAELSIGSYDFYRPSIDISGPLNPERSVRYRLNSVYESAGSFRDFSESDRFFIAPVLTWDIGKNTNLTFEAEYLWEKRPLDRGLVAIGREVADIPFSRRLGNPFDVREIRVWRAGYRFEHKFNENLSIRNAFRFVSLDTLDRFETFPNALNETTGITTQRNFFNLPADDYKTYALQTDVIGKFMTGSIEHTLVFGFDLTRQTRRLIGRTATAPVINIFDPVYLSSRPTITAPPSIDNFTQADNLGIYLQDQIKLTDNLKFLLGGRFDFVNNEVRNYLTGVTTSQDNSAFSPRVGIVYQPIQPISLYASFSRSFSQITGTAFDGSSFEPERGTQYEVGAKADFLDGRLSSTLAFYDLTRSNLTTTDPNNPGFSIQTGEQKSQGIELDIAGEILPGWNVIVTYAYTDARITEDNILPIGNRLSNVPEHSASLWTTYEIQSGNLQGLGFGLGFFYVGERQGDLANTFDLPSYFRTDAALYYRRNNFQAAINIKNLFDVGYFRSATSRSSIDPGTPLTIVGSVSVEF